MFCYALRSLSELLLSSQPDTRIIAAIAGIPGSGKSSLATAILRHTNILLSTSGYSEHAILVNQDGWHLSRAQLSQLPDPKLAFDRRGAHWTFDAESYLAFVRALRAPLSSLTPNTVITAPGFDHAVKDPSPDFVTIMPSHRIILIEGLYVFLNLDVWRDASALLDERWYLAIDNAVARRRLIERHVITGVAKDRAEAEWRADENDIPSK
jgi:pantothenate kinase